MIRNLSGRTFLATLFDNSQQHTHQFGNTPSRDELVMSFDVSTGAAYVVLYSILVFFTLLAVGAAGWLPSCMLTGFCRLGGGATTTTTTTTDGTAESSPMKNFLTTDYFLSARNAAGTSSIALSFFASGMGAWVSTTILPILRWCNSLVTLASSV